MEMHNPPHPGRVLKNSVLREDGGISVTEFAEKLGMTRTAISRVVQWEGGDQRRACCTTSRLPGRSARSWLNMQTEYDLWQIRNKRRPKIERLIAGSRSNGEYAMRWRSLGFEDDRPHERMNSTTVRMG